MSNLAKKFPLHISKTRTEAEDDVDAIGGQLAPVQAPVHITAVPCHNDMLIMFASPQGQSGIPS
jgi:hypothetical protein